MNSNRFLPASALHIEVGTSSTNYLILERYKGLQGDWKVSGYPPTEEAGRRWIEHLNAKYGSLDFILISQKTEVIYA